MVEQDFKKFYESVNSEFDVVKNRVRNLIGDANWGEEGQFKESVLKNIISRFLPKKYSIGTGFVINSNKEITKQIDIIIYDDSSPILFKEGDLVIVLATTVKAIIEVKSYIRSPSIFKKIIKICEENAKIIEVDFAAQNDKLFNGIFSYDSSLSFDQLKKALKGWNEFTDCNPFRKVNNISLSNDKFIHFWHMHPFAMRGYELKDLSFAYFLGNLMVFLDSHHYGGKSIFYPLDSKNSLEIFKIDSTEEYEGYL